MMTSSQFLFLTMPKRFSFSVLFSLIAITSVKPVRLQINAGGAVYNTNTLQNYQSLMQFISTSQDPEIKSYYKELEELNLLMHQSPGIIAHMIGPNLFLAARHVVNPLIGSFNIRPGEDCWGRVSRAFVHPNASYDLVLLTINGPKDQFSQLKPLNRYYGSDLSKADCFALSYTLHNQGGAISESGMDMFSRGRNALHTKGRFPSNQNSPIMHLQSSYHGPKIQPHFLGGDSGAPVFMKVSTTGNLQQDYRYIGFNETGNPLKIVNMTHPSISNWITNVIASIALDQDVPDSTDETSSIEQQDVLYVQAFLKGWTLFSSGIPSRTRGGAFIDPSWLIGVTGQDFLGKEAVIKQIRFDSLNEYRSRHQLPKRSYSIKKSFNLGNGRALALLEKPVLLENPALNHIPVTQTSSRAAELLERLKKSKEQWTQFGIDLNSPNILPPAQSARDEWLSIRNSARHFLLSGPNPPESVANKSLTALRPDDLITPLLALESRTLSQQKPVQPTLTGVSNDITITRTFGKAAELLARLKRAKEQWSAQDAQGEWFSVRNSARVFLLTSSNPPESLKNKPLTSLVPDDLIPPIELITQETERLNNQIQNIMIKEALSPL